MPQISEVFLPVPLNLSRFGGFLISIYSTLIPTMQHPPSRQPPHRIEFPFESLMKLKMQLRRARYRQNERVRQLRLFSTQFSQYRSID
jgi:hypothetical protein